MKFIKQTDPEIYSLIKKEEKRQEETLMMIPSENYASKAVEEAVGSCLGNKYAEGYPHKRYYQGQEFVDQIEDLVINRVKKLFNVPAANVQPLSGSPANFAVYTALLEPGDKLMGLSLSSGGHLTHGAAFNASSKYFQSIPYGLTRRGEIDFQQLEFLAKKEKPQIIIAGTTAYPKRLNWKRFAQIADQVGAYLMADIAHLAGLIVAKAYPSPVPYAHIITTTTHKTLRGPRGAIIMVTKKGLIKDPDLAKKINKAIIPGIQGGPHLNTIAGIGVALKEAATERFKKYAKKVVNNAKKLAEELKKYDFNLVGGGTESHLLLIDLRNKNLLGNTAAEGLEQGGIIVNKNSVPFDTNPPFYPSGIRLGTPGITSRGMGEKEMELIAQWINTAINGLLESKRKKNIPLNQEKKKTVRKTLINSTKVLKTIKTKVKRLCQKFPVKEMY